MLVRPQLEYGSEAWNPQTLTSIQSLEKVQRAAACFVYQDYRRVTSVTALVNKLGWDTLHNRRLLAQSTLFYKMHHHQLNMPFPTHIIPAT